MPVVCVESPNLNALYFVEQGLLRCWRTWPTSCLPRCAPCWTLCCRIQSYSKFHSHDEKNCHMSHQGPRAIQCCCVEEIARSFSVVTSWFAGAWLPAGWWGFMLGSQQQQKKSLTPCLLHHQLDTGQSYLSLQGEAGPGFHLCLQTWPWHAFLQGTPCERVNVLLFFDCGIHKHSSLYHVVWFHL